MKKYHVGIDEAGRGPIAGPVCVGGVSIPIEKYPQVKKICKAIRGKDSKKLTEKQRDEWFKKIQQMQSDNLLQYTGVMVGASQIDKKGIVPSIQKAMNRALLRLCKKPNCCQIKLDGSLVAHEKYTNQETIIKGDEKELVISLASICAKVVRDKKMVQLSKRHSEFGFEKHKGYGTRSHYEAISKHGKCKEHRSSFLH